MLVLLLYLTILWHLSLSITIIDSPNKPLNDDRTYLAIRLDNKLEVLLISDPNANKAAASLSVGVGSWSDPDDVEGLANFLSHVILNGQERQTGSGFVEWIYSHSGAAKAYTTNTKSTFVFDCARKSFEEALAKFSDAIKHPLRTPSSIERELSRIDAEHHRNRQRDSWRFRQVLRDISDPTHPFHNFNFGNMASLSRPDILTQLATFYDNHYYANRMKVVMLGTESIGELQDIAIREFGDIVTKDIPIPIWSGNPFAGKYGNKFIQMKSFAATNDLILLWDLPPMKFNKNNDPTNFIQYLFTASAPNSFYDVMKMRGWIEELYFDKMVYVRDVYLFYVKVELSDSGMDHMEEVIDGIFQYLSLIKLKGLNNALWKEMQTFMQLEWKFRERTTAYEYVSEIADNFQEVKSLNLLNDPPKTWNKTFATEMMDSLHPQKLSVILIMTPQPNVELKIKEYWYGMNYSKVNISSALVSKLTQHLGNTSRSFILPINRAEFVSTNFEVGTYAGAEWDPQRPVLLSSIEYVRVWWGSDIHFETPETLFKVHFAIPKVFGIHSLNLTSISISMLYTRMVESAMELIKYKSEPAGYAYSLELERPTGFVLTVTGYNHKFQRYLQAVLNVMHGIASFRQDKITFEMEREHLLQYLDNFNVMSGKDQAFQIWEMWMTEKTFDPQELRIKMAKLRIDEFQRFVSTMFSDAFIESFTYGNTAAHLATSMTESVEETLKITIIPEDINNERTHFKSDPLVLLDCGTSFEVSEVNHNEHDKTSTVLITYQVGMDMDPKLYIPVMVLGKILQVACYLIGISDKDMPLYQLSCGTKSLNGILYMTMALQSSHHTCDQLILLNDDFMDRLLFFLEKLDHHNVHLYKQAVEIDLTTKEATVFEEAERYWSQIKIHTYHFNRLPERLKELELITNKTIVSFYRNALWSPDNRRRFIMRIEPEQSANLSRSDVDMETWKNEHPRFPDVALHHIEGAEFEVDWFSEQCLNIGRIQESSFVFPWTNLQLGKLENIKRTVSIFSAVGSVWIIACYWLFPARRDNIGTSIIYWMSFVEFAFSIANFFSLPAPGTANCAIQAIVVQYCPLCTSLFSAVLSFGLQKNVDAIKKNKMLLILLCILFPIFFTVLPFFTNSYGHSHYAFCWINNTMEGKVFRITLFFIPTMFVVIFHIHTYFTIVKHSKDRPEDISHDRIKFYPLVYIISLVPFMINGIVQSVKPHYGFEIFATVAICFRGVGNFFAYVFAPRSHSILQEDENIEMED